VLGLAAGGFLYFNDIFRGAPADQGESGGGISFSTYPLPFPSPTGPGDPKGFGVYTLDPPSGEPVLVSGDAQAFSPAWSPDGSVLAYVISGPGSPQDPLNQVWVVNTDGSDPRLLLDVGGSVDSIAWSPDGRSMVIARERTQGEAQGPMYDVVIADTTNGHIGAPLPIADGVVEVDWSPDGSRLVVGREGQGLALVDIDGGNERTIVKDPSAHSPAWSPDGRTIAYLAADSGGSSVTQVFTVDPDGGTPNQLTNGPTYASGPSWAPDGGKILFGSMQAEYDRFSMLKEPATCLLETVRVDGTGRAVLSDGVPEDTCVRATSWAPTAASHSPTPSSSPSAPAEGQDVGLPFRICDVSTLAGIRLTDAGPARVWVVTRVTEADRCPDLAAKHVVAADIDLDGVADVWTEMTCRGGCQPLPRAAMDLTADGTDELFVLEDLFSVADYQVFTIVGGELVAATVAPPGHPEAGLIPGEVAVLSVGGDEGFGGYLRCEGDPAAPTLVVTWSEHPVEGPGSDVKQVHETRLVMEADGTFRVTSSSDTTLPAGQAPPGVTGSSTEASCGIELGM
jgi:WD40 repeat protein